MFKGEFESGQAVDANIDGLAAKEMSFPLQYGYCAVGRVIKTGKENTHYLNKKVKFSLKAT